ncbi:hypothetical protein Ahy_B04g070880 isoform B [Arachis hypogaea]|uniref:FAR1 domain-containing protein n=1 Tax=Arachis hypogaea TaxID=3818 RepID=A0A444ZJD1_ARAHY|nr:hypothetical protein Ahy_B04g070880 isoform B [Arachis hypogaea]
MTFNTLEDTTKFYKDYSKAVGFSTRIRSTNKKGNKIKNQLITCSKEGKWKSKISPTERTNPSAGLNCPTRIYIHILKDIGVWIISKVVLHHSHSCFANQVEMLKQYRKLSMSVRCTIENNEEAGIRPSKTYQSYVVEKRHEKLHQERSAECFGTRGCKRIREILIKNEREESEFLFRAQTRG